MPNVSTVELPADFARRLAELGAVSDRIRFLDRQGYARADIARILGKRYQHVRNVLEQDAAKASPPELPPAPPAAASATRSANAISETLTVGAEGLALPLASLARIGVRPGDRVRIGGDGEALELTRANSALDRARALVRGFDRGGDGSVVDELIAERRAAGRRE